MWIYFVQSAFVVSNNFIEQHSELISEVSNAYALSCNFINEQPAEAARMLVAKGMMPDEQTAQTALPLCNIRYVSAFAIERETRRYLEIFHDLILKPQVAKPMSEILFTSN
jgi:NitT/TauT family transport system substrate-binding protein